MKILVHMGTRKTGTTSLQASLHNASAALRDRGVFYPKFGHQTVAHHLLMGLCVDPSRLPKLFCRAMGGPDAAVEKARVAWDMVCRDVQRRRPEVLVLSSEALFLSTNAAEKAKLVGRLSELSDDIVPILYVRHPVPDFRSNLQENLKNSSRSFWPHGHRLKSAVLETEAAFRRPLQLVAFDQKVLHGGDTIADFATRFLSTWVKAKELPALRSNAGLSAEALVLMARLRAEGGNTDEVAFRVRSLTSYLRKLDIDDPPVQSLTLLPEVAEATLRSATSHRWLVETGQLEIPGLDISKIDGAPPPGWMRSAPPESLFQHDPERLDRLKRSVEALQRRAIPHNQPTQQSGPTIPQRTQPRMRDSLLRFLRRKLASFQNRKTGIAQARAETARPSSQGDRNEET